MLAEEISALKIDIIIGIARAGLYPATLLSGMLQKELHPARLSRRENDVVKYDTPKWITDLPKDIKKKNILIIDEIADSGETLQKVSCRARELSAGSITTACLVTHSWADPKPDYFALESDELIIFPWDKQILKDGEWILHPELADALKIQNRK